MNVRHIILSGALIAGAVIPGRSFEPKELPGYAINRISPDGSLAVSYAYGFTAIIDLETGDTYEYAEGYAPGSGDYVSANGIVVGSTSHESACYWKNGSWHDIESGKARTWSYANGITPDGTRIVGMVTPGKLNGYEGLLLVPCYWDLQSDGTYGEINLLPYPDKDISGRTPMYITATRISEDGTVIAGQVLDYSGTICRPIVYTLDSNGEWQYTLLLDELYHPAGFDLPPDPGEAPEIEDYMTAENRAAYEAAVEYWNEHDFDNYETYPAIDDYISLEEYDQYISAYDAWEEKWDEFRFALYELMDEIPIFEFNNLFLSEDGKTYVSTRLEDKSELTAATLTPYIIDIPGGTYTMIEDKAVNPRVTTLAKNGILLAQSVDIFGIRNAYIKPAGSNTFETLYEYTMQRDPELGEWIKQNLFHSVELISVDQNGQETTTTEYMSVTGIPFSNYDLSIIGLTVENSWDYDSGYLTYGYILDYSTAGVKKLQVNGSSDVKVLRGGDLIFTGDVKTVTVFNLNGMAVVNVNNPGSSLSTGLSSGVYVVKVVATDGSVTIKKVNI